MPLRVCDIMACTSAVLHSVYDILDFWDAIHNVYDALEFLGVILHRVVCMSESISVLLRCVFLHYGMQKCHST